MLSKFFIDRPIFATVLSVVITLTGAIALVNLPIAQYPRITPPSINVSISYPGASAQVVADTVAAPIEQQVTGVPGMLYMSSQMGNDGSYSLSVTFDVGVDLNTALVMVQNRVALAMPLLPSPVQKQGISIRKRTPDILCMVNFVSQIDPETGKSRFDDLYLSNYALIFVKDELLRVDGVSDVSIMGERDYSIRCWLDPQKLASMNMTAIDVANAVRGQNVEAAVGQLGQQPAISGQAFQVPLDTLGRLTAPEDFANIIIKVGSGQLSSGMVSPSAAVPLAKSSAATTFQSTLPFVNIVPDLLPTPGVAGGGSNAGLVAGTTAGKSKSTAAAAKSNNPPMAPSVSIVRLRDVARVERGAQNYNQFCTFDGGPAVGLSVYQLPGTNALDVGDRIHAKMEELKTRFPEGVEYKIAYDTTPFIRESIADVLITLLEAIVLVAIVVLVFLQDWRAMILPMIDVPVSLIGTFAVMAVMGYSLNNISLFGLVLAIGIVVDDAIVVLENIERQLARGLDTRTATIKAMEEISGPILAITLVLCAVFIPCAFIGGITGRFFRQFAVTIAASTVISAINALTMTPSRALVIFRSREKAGVHQHKPEALPWWIFGVAGGFIAAWVGPRLVAGQWGLPAEVDAENTGDIYKWFVRAAFFTPALLTGLVLGWFIIRPVNAVLGAFFLAFNAFFDAMTWLYGWTIGTALKLSGVVLLVYGGMLVLTYWVFQIAPTGFVPQQDQGRLIASVQLPDSSSQERTRVVMADVDKIIREHPAVAHTIGLGGISFVERANGPNFGSFFVILKPFQERQETTLRAEAVMKVLRKEWEKRIKDARVVVSGTSPIPGISTSGGFKVMIEDRGGLGLRTLQDQADKVIQKIKVLKVHDEPALAGVSTQFRSNTPQLYMDIDRTKVASLGVALEDVNQTLQIYLGSFYVNSFNEFGRHWQVTLQADKAFRSRIDDVNLLQVRNNRGQMVPLGTLVTVKEVTGPIFVVRYNLYTAAPTGGSLLPGISSGDVIAGVNELAATDLPRSMKAEWTELMFMQIKEGSTTGIVFALAVVCVFLALAALYESWTLPLAVILVVPLCVLCSLAGVLFTNNSLNIFVQIGLVVLVGLACKNAILVVEFAKQLHLEGKSLYEATLTASKLRLRPILMTSFAFILGVVPLCVASGPGAEMRKSLGTAVFSGMLGVTMFGIFLTPVFFYVIQGVGATKVFASATTRWVGSCMVGAFLGGAIGWLLAKLDIGDLTWGPIVGASAGLSLVTAVLAVHWKVKTR